MNNTATMYRTITATQRNIKGILCPVNGEEKIDVRLFTDITNKPFTFTGDAVTLSDGSRFYPAVITGERRVNYKCTMTEQEFIKNSTAVESRFVNGRTRMVTRNVKSYVAVCMVFSMAEQKMKTAEYSLPSYMNKEKALTYVKRVHEDTSIYVIAMVQDIKQYEGIRAMTESKFFELAEREEVEE